MMFAATENHVREVIHAFNDTPIGHYVPRLVPGQRGGAITIRMLLDHTSGLAEHLPYAYPSLTAFPALANTGPQAWTTTGSRSSTRPS